MKVNSSKHGVCNLCVYMINRVFLVGAKYLWVFVMYHLRLSMQCYSLVRVEQTAVQKLLSYDRSVETCSHVGAILYYVAAASHLQSVAPTEKLCSWVLPSASNTPVEVCSGGVKVR